jgi:hypothetical protein
MESDPYAEVNKKQNRDEKGSESSFTSQKKKYEGKESHIKTSSQHLLKHFVQRTYLMSISY